MIYEIQKIGDISQFKTCPIFQIDHFQWHSIYHPKALGCVSYIENQGFHIWLACEEMHPKADYTLNFQPVYKDSALEAFFQFDLKSPQYFNFEFNAKGACIAAFGASRHPRINLTKEQILSLKIQPMTTPLGWQIHFFIPEELLRDYQPEANWKRTRHLRCNFYKLSEAPEIEHYASFAPVPGDTPNFHQIQTFADARICDNITRTIQLQRNATATDVVRS